jgi:6-phosphogluconolactonase (cycloisomerase 2 family)
MAPSGRFLYLLTGCRRDPGFVAPNHLLFRYSIDQSTGKLTPPLFSLSSPHPDPLSMALDPSGRFLYETYGGTREVSVYQVDTATGALSGPSNTNLEALGPNSLFIEPGGSFAVATHASSNTVSVYSIDQTSGALTRVGFFSATGRTPVEIAFARGAHPVSYLPLYAYAANRDSNDVNSFSVDPNSGRLSALGRSLTGDGPLSIAVDPFGRFVWVADSRSNDIVTYQIGSSGLRRIGTPTMSLNPTALVVDPSGRLLYAAKMGLGGISQIAHYAIDPATGALSPATAWTGPFGSISKLTFSPNGRYVFAAFAGIRQVVAFGVDPLTGDLSLAQTLASGTNMPLSTQVDTSGTLLFVIWQGTDAVSTYALVPQLLTSPVANANSPNVAATGSNPVDIAVDPTGRFVYVVNRGADSISAFTIARDFDSLQPNGEISVGAGTTPADAEVDPSGSFLFVAREDGTVATLKIDPSTGTLSDPGLSVTAGTLPLSLGVDGEAI